MKNLSTEFWKRSISRTALQGSRHHRLTRVASQIHSGSSASWAAHSSEQFLALSGVNADAATLQARVARLHAFQQVTVERYMLGNGRWKL